MIDLKIQFHIKSVHIKDARFTSVTLEIKKHGLLLQKQKNDAPISGHTVRGSLKKRSTNSPNVRYPSMNSNPSIDPRQNLNQTIVCSTIEWYQQRNTQLY